LLQAREQRRSFTCAQAAALVERAALQPGERVLDLAAGTGWVTLPAAHRVGPAGAVLGVDVTDAMLAVVRGGPHHTLALCSRQCAVAVPLPLRSAQLAPARGCHGGPRRAARPGARRRARRRGRRGWRM